MATRQYTGPEDATRSMLPNEELWPIGLWPCLPLKNRKAYNSLKDPFGRLGYLVSGTRKATGKYVVYLGNIFMVDRPAPNKVPEKEEFETLEALMEAGWIVD